SRRGGDELIRGGGSLVASCHLRVLLIVLQQRPRICCDRVDLGGGEVLGRGARQFRFGGIERIPLSRQLSGLRLRRLEGRRSRRGLCGLSRTRSAPGKNDENTCGEQGLRPLHGVLQPGSSERFSLIVLNVTRLTRTFVRSRRARDLQRPDQCHARTFTPCHGAGQTHPESRCRLSTASTELFPSRLLLITVILSSGSGHSQALTDAQRTVRWRH